MAGLQSLARMAGRTLEVCRCQGLRDLVTQLRTARERDAEFILIDPGELAHEARIHPEEGLHDALGELASPYIEVHDDDAETLEETHLPHGAPLATIVIHGDLATSYRIAMNIALRQLAA